VQAPELHADSGAILIPNERWGQDLDVTDEELLTELRRRIAAEDPEAPGVWVMVDYEDGEGPQEMEVTSVRIAVAMPGRTEGALVFSL
jgi:hypothetical protein